MTATVTVTTPTPVAVTGVVQHYAWGHPTYIAELLGHEPDGRPWAELWLGTHPSAPTRAGERPLVELTGPLPYLVKVLAAAAPLSLQVHPTREQAIEGFARGVYPDDQEKPELLCALTSFDALCGVRPLADTLDLLDTIGATELRDALATHGIGATITALYAGKHDIEPTITACTLAADAHEEAALVAELAAVHPGDPSVVVTLLLNRVHLEPGEALHLTAGNLHAYLSGAGIELMGSSDNVVRGGLTVKHVDVTELLRILDPTPLADPVMRDAAETGVYRLPEAGCALVRIEPDTTHTSTGHELTISMDGSTLYLPPGTTLTPTAPTWVVVVE